MQPHTQQSQGLSVRRAMHLLRFRGQAKCPLVVPAIERLPRRLTQPPRLQRQAHERPQIRPATRADPRAAKARLADRAEADSSQSALPLDEEQQFFEAP